MIEIEPEDVLLIVDVQYDFLPNGSLAVTGGDEIVPLINQLAKKFKHVVLTQDWHPADHISFASQHEGKTPFETVELDYGTQVLWPDHCVWNTHGAEISHNLDVPQAQLIIRKGYNRGIDSYSGFQEADRETLTGLAGYLNERDIGRLFVVGLATDFCVAWTALDAAAGGFDVTVIEDATRAIDSNGSLEQAWTDMTEAGVERVQSRDILG
ncbi:bifunctional nicotinamidase/pyrazinamidase [Devosia aurantiaca]|uniref:Nicotinamidase n=1 Tax=Devosia aurantiaca TaxID=2714858 RepID=A0A6M1SIT8_9HYPH|nr:bifunctional nicotinamidase/pyrazinamidase [Devosia aurantiaca]NGP16754.1 bifunctional nicotinamidase/pyrazinamidase [Devosia aurantiaca]